MTEVGPILDHSATGNVIEELIPAADPAASAVNGPSWR